MFWIMNLYFIIGLLFGVYFTLIGCVKIDPTAGSAKLMVRLLWFPAAAILWPILLLRLTQTDRKTDEVTR